MPDAKRPKLTKVNEARGSAWLDDIPIPSSRKAPVRIVDLFAGIGGFHYGIAAAAAARDRRVEAVLVSEIDENCKSTYFACHGATVHGSIKQVVEDLRNKSVEDEVDILTAGFPCQPFSNSGLKRGLSDPRGQFYNKIEALIIKYNAKSFILENVPGIRTNGEPGGISKLAWSQKDQRIGSTMKTLEGRLKALGEKHGYWIRWIEINSSDFGSPQVRRRVYIIGLKKDYSDKLDLDFDKVPGHSFFDIREGEDVPGTELSTSQEKNLRSSMKSSPSYKDGMRRVGQAYACPGGNVGQGYHAMGRVPTLTKVWARFLPVYFPVKSEKIPLLDSPDFAPGPDYGKGTFRRASLREVMRLQGFPDSFLDTLQSNGAVTPRVVYEQAGNAVNALVVKHLAERLLDQIKK
jgi:DNA (cytosine-5)-methyltransferase 1